MPTPLFQCSACGAPLLPKSSAAVISCPYCHASVVVPQALRVEPAAWPWVLSENFTNNENNWLVGDYVSEYFAHLTQTIAEGRYRWTAQARRVPTVTTAWVAGHPVADFYLSATGKHLHGSKTGSSWGVIFHIQNNHSYYWFRVTDNQQFAISVVKDLQWQHLREWTRTDAIKPYGVNQLEVIAQATHYTCLINGRIVGEVEDAHLIHGAAGLAIETYTANEEAVYDFLDFSLRAP